MILLSVFRVLISVYFTNKSINLVEEIKMHPFLKWYISTFIINALRLIINENSNYESGYQGHRL